MGEVSSVWQYQGGSCDEVYRQAAGDIAREGVEQPSRTELTKEIRHAVFSVNSPRDRVIFSRPINPAFAIVEVLWIMAGRRDEDYLHFWNPRMDQWADDDGNLSGYGYRLRQHFGIDQLKRATRALRQDKTSRQIVLQIWDPVEDLPNPNPRSKDVPCNCMSHLLLRDGELHWLQIMRSNDLVWGLPYNFIQFTVLQEIMSGWLGVQAGSYSHLSSSLHVYSRHWNDLQSITDTSHKPTASPPDLRMSEQEWDEVEEDLTRLPIDVETNLEASRIDRFLERYSYLPNGYQDWAALLAAEALRRKGNAADAFNVITRAGEYWEASWKQWAESQE